LWEETLEDGQYAIHRLGRGTVVRLEDVGAEACAHVMVHHADLPSERLNLADTTKVQWQLYPTTGSVLLSDRGRVLMTIVGDTSGRHDTICGAPTATGRPRLILALAKVGLDRRDLAPSISFFKGVRVGRDGALELDTTGGGNVELRAELDVYFSVVNVAHCLDGRYPVCTPLRITARPGEPTAADDPRRLATPEIERAFLNTDDWAGCGR
jgi:hypothetical protein